MYSFKSFQSKYKKIATNNENYAEVLEKYKCILFSCPLNYIGHYWKALLEGMLFISAEVALLLKESLLLHTSSVESVELSEIKIHLQDIAKDMKAIVGQLGNTVMHKRSRPPPNGLGDIRYGKCSFDYLITKQIIIVSTDNQMLLNLPADETFSFEPRNMSDEINSLIVPNPPGASEGYDHSVYLLRPFSCKVSASSSKSGVVANISSEVEQFNKTNGFGTRKQPTSTTKRRERLEAAEKYPDVSPTKAAKQADADSEQIGARLSFTSPVSSLQSECNTTAESVSVTDEGGEDFNNDQTVRQKEQPDFDSLDLLVNNSCGTPVHNAFDDTPVSPSLSAPPRPPYNFDDESQNIQPKFTSSFLTTNQDTSEDSDDQRDFSSRNKRQPQQIAPQDISASEEEESVIDEYASDSSFFVKDGQYEGKHPASAFKAREKPPKKAVTLKNGGIADEEFSSSDDEAKVFKVVKGGKGDKPRSSKPGKASGPSGERPKSKAAAARAKRLVVVAVNHKPTTMGVSPPSPEDISAPTFNKVLKSVVIKKRTRDEYRSNPLEDLSVHVTNEIRTIPFPSSNTTSSVVVPSTPGSIAALKAENKAMDRNFILFLVKNCTTRISADIALERCIMDYLCRKQALNNVSPSEQQRIDNLEEIFLSIEALISNEIKAEHDRNHNVLERAHQRTKKNILYKCSMRASMIQQSDVSDEQKLVEEDELKEKERVLVEKLNVMAAQAKMFNAQTCRFSLRKINTTLHFICGKFCVIWLEANNCIGEINPEVLRHYTNRAATDAAFVTQLTSATKNGVFLLDCDLELADGVETRGTLEQQQKEEEELRRILDGDHVQQVVKTIKSIAENADRIKSLVKIVWTKETRVKLSHSIAKARKAAEGPVVATTASIKDGSSPHVMTPTASTVADGIPIATSVQLEGGSQPLSLASAAVGTKKITSFYGVDQTAEDSNASSSHSHTVSSHQASAMRRSYNNKFAADPNSSLTKIARTFDQAFLLITGRVQAVSDTQCLQITVKSRSLDSMLLRLKLFRFLITHKTESYLEVMKLLKDTEMYELFDCFFLLKTSNVKGSNTCGDGYCFTRCEYQLYQRSQNDFKTTVAEMRELDKACNSANSKTNTNEAFRSFIAELPVLMKAESRENQTLINAMSEIVYFKRQKQLEIMPALLSVRPPGEPLDALFWGDIQTVTMLGFNVSAFAKLVDEEFIRMIPEQRQNWIKYEASSVPKARSAGSVKLSKRPLSDIDQVLAEDLNIMVYAGSHYFVCDSPGPINQVVAVFDGLKASIAEELLNRIALVEGMTPDLLQQLNNIIDNCEGKSQVVDFDYFDCATFEHKFAKKYPEATVDRLTIDLSQEDENGETDKEIYKLKEALELSKAKLKIMEDFGAVLRQNCCALDIAK